jgi:hypothetical protein
LIRDVGRSGIPVFGYNFSLAGVAGRISGPFARGGAESVGGDAPIDLPIPKGMVWNMVYLVSSPAPWYVGMAYALGYIRALIGRVKADAGRADR